MRILKLYLVATWFLFIGGCKEKKSNDIPKEKMQAVVLQLMKADEHIARMSAQDTTWKKSSKSAELYQKIFDLNNVDRVQFYKQMEFIIAHPIELKALLDEVNELSKREKNTLVK